MQEQAEEELESYSISAKYVYNWIKKTNRSINKCQFLELDELYWFIGKEGTTETKENTYIMTMASRMPRQIVGLMLRLISLRNEYKKLWAMHYLQRYIVLMVGLDILM